MIISCGRIRIALGGLKNCTEEWKADVTVTEAKEGGAVESALRRAFLFQATVKRERERERLKHESGVPQLTEEEEANSLIHQSPLQFAGKQHSMTG